MGTNTIIALSKIKKVYDLGAVQVLALNEIDLSIEQNEFVAIIGQSGSGKSTLMNVLGCLDLISSGHYKLNGTDVSKFNDADLARTRNLEIGFVFQMFNLLSKQTATENVELPMIYAGIAPEERKVRAVEMLKKVGLGDRLDHRPSEMSGGQQQRIAIARALINNPSIILADEPTGNLDSKTTVDIMRLFQEIHDQGNTVIFITHENEIAQHAHRIIALRDGQILTDEKNHNVTRVN